MLRFFRSIRQSLLLRRQGSEGQVIENKTWRYLKYAVGEIVLIMVGIFLALQLNNWNEGRLDRIEEAEILAGLEREFEAYYEDFSFGRDNRYESIISSLEAILKAIKKGSWESDEITLDFALYHALRSPTSDHGGGVLDAMVQSGRLELVQDKALREKLVKWIWILRGLQDQQQANRKFMIENVFPYLSKHGIQLSGVFAAPEGRSWPVDTVSLEFDMASKQKLLSDPEFRTLIELRYRSIGYTADRSLQQVIEAAEEILEHIKHVRFE